MKLNWYFASIVLLCALPLSAQTVYYNHPKGVTFGFSETTVAKLTLPAGTYHVIFKSDFSPAPGQTPDGEPRVIDCRLLVTGIPNVSSPYTADVMSVPIATETGQEINAVQGVMETAFHTNGGTVTAKCIDIDRAGYLVTTAYINLSATKITTLVRQ